MPKQEELDELFIDIVERIGKMSKCVSHQVGAVIVQDGRIISIGYNGTPKGMKNCNENFKNYNSQTQRENHKKFSDDFEIHAEMNAIIFAAKNGIKIDKSTFYCLYFPCKNCLKSILNSGINRIVYKNDYDRVSTEEKNYLINLYNKYELKIEKIGGNNEKIS